MAVQVLLKHLGDKMMDSNVETVRVTRTPFALSKKHTLVAAIVVLAVLVGVGLWLGANSSALYPVMSVGKYGYMNKSAKVVIPPQFDRAGLFADGLAAVAVGNRWGFIDQSGKLAIAPRALASLLRALTRCADSSDC